jgi:predicted ATPase
MSNNSLPQDGPLADGLLAGRYRLEVELGQGGMGELFRGVDTQTGEVVAVKALKPEILARDPDILARFVREGEALRQLNHPNIVKMLDTVSENDRHYLIMEYISGGDLRQLLDKEATLPIRRVAEIALDLADALTRAHRLSIIHRDLKPANILITDGGAPKLTDFGTAHMAGVPALTQTGMIVGTVHYLSPEACNGERLDERADIWSFGVLLYEMLVGERPFAGNTLAASLAAILSQPVPDICQLRPDVPDSLADLVYRMLEKERLARIPSVRLVGAELEAILREDDWPDLAPKTTTSGTLAARQPAPSLFAVPTPAAGPGRHNLPAQITSFVGRGAELADLARLLNQGDTRLVTILGAGGMGKSRLALALAASQLDQYPDGVYFVPLVGLSDPEAIIPAIAEATNQLFSQARSQLLDYLREKRLLLLLDNFEHLLDGVDIVSEILQIGPQVKILATSRVKLGVQGEHQFPLSGMAVPEAAPSGGSLAVEGVVPVDVLDYNAMKLFVQSARRARSGIELQADDWPQVAHICRLVQGMPLGIILAAAWMEMLTPSEIAAEIEKSLDFLEGDMQDVPGRHRSMRAVLDHTWRQLSSHEQQLLAFISIFRGEFTRPAVQAITGASLRDLMALTNKSLLERSPQGRYQIHGLLRWYAAEKLAKQTVIDSRPAETWIRDQHSAYYCSLLKNLATDLKSAAAEPANAQIWADILNFRLAWDWALEQEQVTYLAQAQESLCLFYWWQGQDQQRETYSRQAAEKLSTLLHPSLSPSGELLRLYARLRAWQGVFAFVQENLAGARRYGQKALDVLIRSELANQDTQAERAFALMALGRGHSRDQREKAGHLFRESLALFQSLADRWGSSQVYQALGIMAYDAGDYGLAETHFLDNWRLSQALGHQIDSAVALYYLGHSVFRQGRFEEGESWLRQGVEICRNISNWPGVSLLMNGCSEVLILLGRFDEAQELLVESINYGHFIGHRVVMSFAQCHWSEASLHLGHYEKARQELAEILVFFRQQENSWGVAFCQHMLACVQIAVGNDEEASRLLQKNNGIYREMKNNERLCWTLIGLSLIASRSVRSAEVRASLREALEIVLDIRNPMLVFMALPAVALYRAVQGETETAIEIYALATSQPYVEQSLWYQEVVGQYITADLSSEVIAAAQERGRARDLWQTAEELLAQLQVSSEP